MFKDIYKAACDDIKPDPYLIGKIIDKSQAKSRPVFFRYAFSACAAAIALAIMIPTFLNSPGTNIMSSDIKSPKNTVETMPQTEIAPANQEPPEITHDTNSAPVYISDSINKPESAPYESYSVVKEDPAPIYSTPSSGSLEEVTQAVAENSAAESNQTPIVMSINNIAASSGSAGANSRQMFFTNEPMQVEYEEMSVTDYFEHIAFSPDNLEIPEGLTADYTPDSIVQIEKTDGAISSDIATFTFSGDSFVSVTTSSNAESVSAVMGNEEYEKTQIGDKSVVVTYDGSVYQGYYITPEGTAVTISSVDLTEEQFKDLIISATE